jgi:hypothetical protein
MASVDKKITKMRTNHGSVGLEFCTNYEQLKLAMLLHNSGFCGFVLISFPFIGKLVLLSISIFIIEYRETG